MNEDHSDCQICRWLSSLTDHQFYSSLGCVQIVAHKRIPGFAEMQERLIENCPTERAQLEAYAETMDGKSIDN